MVQKIRTSIMIILTIINFICMFAIFLLNSLTYSEYKHKNWYVYNNDNMYYNNITNSDSSQYKDRYYNNEYQFNSSFYFSSVLTLNCLSSFFWFFLLCSFCTGECDCSCNSKGCCSDGCTCNSNNCGNCNCNNNSGDCGKLAIVCLIFICLFLIIYYALKCLGKHIARYVALSSIFFINFCLFVVSLLVINNYDYNIIRIMIFSGIAVLLNLLAISLPNVKSCERFRFKERIPSSEIINYNINPNQISQINNNVMINNNMNIYNNEPVPNYPIYPNNDKMYPLSIVNNESNNEKPNVEKNVSINSNDTNDQFADVNNKDLGDAPLPAYEMQTNK